MFGVFSGDGSCNPTAISASVQSMTIRKSDFNKDVVRDYHLTNCLIEENRGCGLGHISNDLSRLLFRSQAISADSVTSSESPYMIIGPH